MQRLWAPWRMEYIGGEQRPGCLFCRVIADPNDPDADLVLWRPEGAIVILNKFPYNPGHAMVAPVAHVATLEDLDDGATTDLMRAVRRTLAVLRESMNPDGINAGVNIGRPAGWGQARRPPGLPAPGGRGLDPGRRVGRVHRRVRAECQPHTRALEGAPRVRVLRDRRPQRIRELAVGDGVDRLHGGDHAGA